MRLSIFIKHTGGKNMFKFFKKPKLTSLSFYDWANRAAVILRESVQEVSDSEVEDTIENVLKVFSKKASSLLNDVEGLVMHVNPRGIYVVNQFNKNEIYILNIGSTWEIKVPLHSDFEEVSIYNHVAGLLTDSYRTILSKLQNKKSRLISEIEAEIARKTSLIESIDSENDAVLEIIETLQFPNKKKEEFKPVERIKIELPADFVKKTTTKKSSKSKSKSNSKKK
jgi:hypothetical protein